MFCSGVFIANFELISDIVLEFPLLTWLGSFLLVGFFCESCSSKSVLWMTSENIRKILKTAPVAQAFFSTAGSCWPTTY